ncbi:MAG: phosphoadenylyl-sulfate reductase [Gammaproteobacteria bacterium]
MALSTLEIRRQAKIHEDRHPREILRLALESCDDVAISFSGAEDVALIDMAVRIDPKVKVFSLDTGRLHAETYRYLEHIRKHYRLNLEMLSPDTFSLQDLVRRKGLFSFYEDGHHECCGIRKVEPLRRRLATVDAWITGQRRDQSPTRLDVPIVQIDTTYGTDEHPLIKFNPLAGWRSEQVWAYIRANNVPYNELHERGYVSIGCEPCTRPVLPHQHEREGRWWWEEETQKECGLHIANGDTGT